LLVLRLWAAVYFLQQLKTRRSNVYGLESERGYNF
jgi:hypothetical protein